MLRRGLCGNIDGHRDPGRVTGCEHVSKLTLRRRCGRCRHRSVRHQRFDRRVQVVDIRRRARREQRARLRHDVEKLIRHRAQRLRRDRSRIEHRVTNL